MTVRGFVLMAIALTAACESKKLPEVSYADAMACFDGFAAMKAKPNISELRVEDVGDGRIRCVAAQTVVVVERIRPSAESVPSN